MLAHTLDSRIERIEAADEIENVMSRYAFYHAACMHDRCLEISALDTPGVSVELPFGVFEGRAGLAKVYLGILGRSDRELAGRAGKLHQNTMTTSVIEVAADGHTAKGVWMCPGHATDRYGGDGSLLALWRWVKYGCDFVKESGGWKIWHLRVYGVFGTSYYTSWTDVDGTGPPSPPRLPPELAPNELANALWQYRKDAVYPNDPAPPEPYITF